MVRCGRHELEKAALCRTEHKAHAIPSRPHGKVTVAPCRAGHGSSVTISKDELAKIARSGYPETARDALPKQWACSLATRLTSRPHRLKRCCSARLRRHTGVAAQPLHRHRGRDGVTLRSGSSAAPARLSIAGPADLGVTIQTPALTRTPRLSPLEENPVFLSRPNWRWILRSSVLRMVCGSRFPHSRPADEAPTG